MVLLYTVITTNMNNDTHFVNIKSVLTLVQNVPWHLYLVHWIIEQNVSEDKLEKKVLYTILQV